MRRNRFMGRSLLALIIVLGCLLRPSITGAQAQSGEDPFIAVVLKVTPPVQLRRADREEFVPLKMDDRVYPGDRIVCSEGGYASLIFADSAVELKLYPDTDLTMQGQRTSGSILKRIFLPIGQLLTKVTRGDMEVVTPTSVASVKGTEWWTFVDATTLTQIIVIEGRVQVEHRATDETEIVTGGTTAVTTPEGELKVNPTQEFEAPEEPGEGKSNLEIEFEDESGQTKTLKIEFER